jgi:tetratricopeptide (TPR) repeat protein
MKKLIPLFVTGLLATTVVACGGGGGNNPVKTPGKPTGPTTASGDALNKDAENKFNAALDMFLAHDKANDWNDGTCADVAKKFESAASEQPGGKFPEATFDAGLAWQRCGKDAEALEHFKKALTDDPKFHHARAQIALYQYKSDGNIDGAIGALQQAVLDAQFQNVPALVNLAMFQMQRDGSTGGQGCKDDMECAKLNLQRALAIDDSYMPAFNQLALYYFAQAKKRAGGISKKGGRSIATNSALGKRADVQQLELASLVCSQAIRKNAGYAPIHNTAGLIQNELGQVNGAVAEFKTAASLDPRFFEAQMNYAFVNLSFRGFDQAEGAFKKALAMRPNDYDAHLGLALALRGQINDSNYDAQVAAVQSELDAAKKIDGARPDAYYNEGILTQEYKAKSGGDKTKTIATLKQAIAILNDFIQKASGKPEYDGAVKRAKDRVQDAGDIITFLETPDDTSSSTPPPPAGGAAKDAPPAPAAGAGGTTAPAQPATPAK